MATTIKDVKRRQKAAAKAATTRKKNQEAERAKKDLASQRRTKTIEVSKKLDARKQARRERRKKFNQFTSKPIVWLFAIVGWGHVFYYLFKLTLLVLSSLGIM